MANPAALADIIKIRATIEAGGGVSQQSFSEPLFASTFDDSVDFPGRIAPYVGQLSDMQAKLVADGFSANDPAYRQITIAKLQLDPPETIYIGRVDPADLTYAEGLTAIWDEAGSDEISLYFLTVDERNEALIEQISDWTAQRTFVLYLAQTASLAVYNNLAGNVAANIIAKSRDTTALIWHDPATASGYAPATLSSLTGPFVLGSLTGDVKFRINDGAEQSFSLVANPATITGLNTEDFVVASGDSFGVTVDNGTLQTLIATLLPATTASGSETFNVPPNSVLQVSFNGAAPLSSTMTGTPGSVTTGDELYAFLALDSVTFDIDGSGAQVIGFDIADTTRADVIAQLAALTGVSVVDTGTGVLITSNTTGSASDVEITAGSANALTELGLVVGNNAGTGFAPNLAVVPASALQVKLAADYAAASAVTVVGTTVKIDTLKIGKAAAVRVLDGIANDALGFSTSEFRGSGPFNDGGAVKADEFVNWFSPLLAGLSFSNVGGAVKLDTRSRGSNSNINIAASTLATTLGLAVGVTASAGSNVANAASVNASEISTVIFGIPVAGGTTAAANAKFTIASTVLGPTSKVEVTGGTYADLLFGDTTLALGTGTDEDYIDCAYVGWCSTFKLDTAVTAGGGQGTWDNVPLVGVLPDKIDPTTRKTLHNTLKVNTFERRLGRNETHFGTVLFGNVDNFRYIDQRVTLDWGWARSVETFKTTLNQISNVKGKVPNLDVGIQQLANDWTAFLRRGESNGHWVFDGTEIQSATDTGVRIPTRAEQTNANVGLRKVAGFGSRFQFQDAIQRVDGDFNLTSFVEFDLNIAA